jgi:ankyrin repeat protein
MARSVSGATPLHAYFTPAMASILRHHSDSIDEEVQDAQGMTILHYIVWSSKSDVQVAKKYIESSGGAASLLVKDNKGRRPLHLAAQRGNVAMVAYILGLEGVGNVDVGDKDVLGLTPIHYAAASKRVQIFDLLKAKGGCVRSKDFRGRAVLHHAISRGYLSTVEKVMALGGAADICAVDENGLSPLDLARSKGVTEIVEFLEREETSLRARHGTCVARSRCESTTSERIGSLGGQPRMQRPSLSRYKAMRVKLPEWDFLKVAVNILFVLFAAHLYQSLEASIRFRS